MHFGKRQIQKENAGSNPVGSQLGPTETIRAQIVGEVESSNLEKNRKLIKKPIIGKKTTQTS